MDENKSIELRSEKVRNIIGQIPSRIVRLGITIIFVVVFAILSGAYFFRFDHAINAQTLLYSKNQQVHYTIKVSQNKMKYINVGQKLVITVHNENSFTTTVQYINTTIRINQNHNYFKLCGVLGNDKIKVDAPTKAQAKIYIGRTNIIDYFFKQ